MFKKLLIASLAVGALGVQVPAAMATHATYDCGFNAVAQETATGGQDTYTGAAYGYIASDVPGESVSLRCYITVDGTDVSSTGTATGTQFAVANGQVTYTATDSQDVKLCAQWTAGAESGSECFESTNQQIPPQEVFDLLDDLFTTIDDTLAPVFTALSDLEKALVDPTVCPVLAAVGATGLANIPDVLVINAQGDVFLLGEAFWDCPPYDLFG